MRKRKEFKRKEGFRPTRLVVIAAEGKRTENIYFEAIKCSLCASNVHVEVLHRETNNSSPESVLKQISAFVREYHIRQDDQLWIVVDRDKWRQEMLANVAQHCVQKKNLKFCLSNPCFELWLILHFEDVSLYSEEDKKLLMENRKVSRNGRTWTKNRMKVLLGQYDESSYDTGELLSRVNFAIERADSLDTNKKDRWPQTKRRPFSMSFPLTCKKRCMLTTQNGYPPFYAVVCPVSYNFHNDFLVCLTKVQLFSHINKL